MAALADAVVIDYGIKPRLSVAAVVAQVAEEARRAQAYPIQLDGHCGETIDEIYVMAEGAGQQQAHLSAQDVASCDKLGDMGCSGGVPSTVYTSPRTAGRGR